MDEDLTVADESVEMITLTIPAAMAGPLTRTLFEGAGQLREIDGKEAVPWPTMKITVSSRRLRAFVDADHRALVWAWCSLAFCVLGLVVLVAVDAPMLALPFAALIGAEVVVLNWRHSLARARRELLDVVVKKGF